MNFKRTLVSIILVGTTALSASVTSYADSRKMNKTIIEHTVTAEGSYKNWDGISSVTQFVGSNGELCFAYEEGDHVVVVRTRGGKTLKKKIKLKKKHPIFGTVTCDSAGNYYLVTGEDNDTDKETQNTVFISKYNKNGKHIKTVGDNGSSSLAYYFDSSYNTKCPFRSGNCDAAISGNVLAVNYARSMYSGHQSNSVFAVNIDTMRPVKLGLIYNSHSFAQRAIPFDGDFLFVSEGDCFSRAFTVTKTSKSNNRSYDAFHFWVENGTFDKYDMYILNDNFAHLGGIVNLGDKKAALVASSVKSLSSDAENEKEQIFIQIFDPDKDLETSSAYFTSGSRSGLSGPNGDEKVTDYGVKWLTDYGDNVSVANPQAVAANGNIVVLYEKFVDGKYAGVYYMVVGPDGKVLRKATLFSAEARLNGYEMPVFAGGKVCWAANKEGDKKNIYIYRLGIDLK